MKKRTVIWIAAAAMILLSGCAVIGRGKDFRPLDEKALAQIKPGITTAGEITNMFGPPNRIVKLSQGNAYLYQRSVSKALGVWMILVTTVNYDTAHDRLVFFFNRSDVLTHYGSSFDAGEAHYGMPF
jgi:hypothetical protein